MKFSDFVKNCGRNYSMCFLNTDNIYDLTVSATYNEPNEIYLGISPLYFELKYSLLVCRQNLASVSRSTFCHLIGQVPCTVSVDWTVSFQWPIHETVVACNHIPIHCHANAVFSKCFAKAKDFEGKSSCKIKTNYISIYNKNKLYHL